MTNILHKELSDVIIKAALKVHETLGVGLLEKLYKKALVLELKPQGYFVEEEKHFQVHYAGQPIGVYFADVVMEGKVIVETKTVKVFDRVMYAQLVNYLKISGIEVGYLINFGKLQLECKRMVG